MPEISGGTVWWFPTGAFRLPTGAESPARITDQVMAYEIDGELRLASSIGTLGQAEVSDTDDHA